MALSIAAASALDAFDTVLSTSYEPSYRHPQHYPQLIRLLVRLIQDSDELFPHDVQAWAMGRGWSEHDACALGEAVIVLDVALGELRLIP
jgi:hypothetical protein